MKTNQCTSSAGKGVRTSVSEKKYTENDEPISWTRQMLTVKIGFV